MSARASFSHDSMIVKMPLPNSILLKDYLLDDLSSCSSNGFRSYPRRQKCCTKVRYLIEIDLNKHIKLPPSHRKLLKTKSKPKSKPKPKLKLKMKSALVLHKASAAVVNVFKKFNFSGSGSGYGNLTKVNCLSKHGFWKRTTRSIGSFERFNSFDESIKRSENMSINLNTDMSPVVNITTKAEMKTSDSKSNSIGNSNTTKAEMKTSRSKSNSNSNSNSSASTDSYFTATSNSSTTGGSSKIVVAENDVIEREELPTVKMNTTQVAVTTVTATNAIGSTKKKLQGEEKDIFSPISVIDFPCDDEEDEVTSPFHHNPFYSKGCKQKLMSKGQRTKSLARLNPVRLEDRIKLSESRTHGWILDQSSSQFQRELAAEKKAIALLQLLKASMSYDTSGSTMTERVLLGFFNERFIEGGVSNYIILQEAKDWINGQTKDMFESQDNKLTCIKEMEKGVNWLKYNEEETREVVSELEYEVYTSLVEETLLEFYL